MRSNKASVFEDKFCSWR